MGKRDEGACSIMKKTVVLFSGGLDSTVLLSYLKKQDEGVDAKIFALSVDYGQRHSKELRAAAQIADSLEIERRYVDLRGIQCLIRGSSQTSDIEVPEGHYEDESMKVTVVPNRNMIMLSLALGWAISLEAEFIAYAAHAGDHAIYPDCRQEFINAFREVAKLAHYYPVHLLSPFANKSKADIVRIGYDVNAPMHLTWSCYKGKDLHCGKCGTCVERKEAFQLAGIIDPTKYEEEEKECLKVT